MSESPQTKIARFITPTDFDEAWRMAEKLATSPLVPKAYQNQPASILIAWEMGAELGLSPMNAIQSIAVINGKPSLYGEAPLAIVMASGLLEEIREEDDGETAHCIVKRKGAPNEIRRSFAQVEAEKALMWDGSANGGRGAMIPLADRPVWRSFPRDMRKYRARGRALKDMFPDVLKGLDIFEASTLTGAERDGGGTVIDVQAEDVTRAAAEAQFMPKRLETTPPAESAEFNAYLKFCGEMVAPAAQDQPAAAQDQPPQTPPETPPPAPAAPVAVKPAEPAAPQPADDAQKGRKGARGKAAEPAQAALPEPAASSAPDVEPAPDAGTGDKPQKFTIGPNTYITKGITREQMLRTFKLVPEVETKSGPGTARTLLEAHFAVKTRNDLTSADADKFIALLEEQLR